MVADGWGEPPLARLAGSVAMLQVQERLRPLQPPPSLSRLRPHLLQVSLCHLFVSCPRLAARLINLCDQGRGARASYQLMTDGLLHAAPGALAALLGRQRLLELSLEFVGCGDGKGAALPAVLLLPGAAGLGRPVMADGPMIDADATGPSPSRGSVLK